MVKQILFALFLTTFLAGAPFISCQKFTKKEPEVNHNYQVINLYVRYLEPDQKMEAEAVVYEKDSSNSNIPVSVDKGVFFEDGAMSKKELLNGQRISYKTSRKKKFDGSYSFKFNFSSTDSLILEVDQSPIDSFWVLGPVSRNKSAFINWISDPLLVDESLVVLFNDKTNSATSFELKGPSESKKFEIPPKTFENTEAGEVQYYLVKRKLSNTLKENLTIITNLEYYSKVNSLTLVN